ncbi:MAG TPA: alpha-L-arabinofuranosidase C-terminal domain-containing protein [Blastocatellia bacterium]|nr:alpha-L-arabinofuranosidase C-terminal domain-containing protein [Blastocatellia bacterium]
MSLSSQISNFKSQISNRFLPKPCLTLALLLTLIASQASGVAAQPARATISVDASKVEGRISPLLYGQFAEFMFEGIKGGLHAELIRNRSFEEPANATGLSRYWERYPDDRNDDYGLSFGWDAAVSYPVRNNLEREAVEHSLRIEVGAGVVEPHGVYQSRIPIRQGLEYRGYLWLKTADFVGQVTAALEADITGGERYAAAEIGNVGGDWKKYEFTLKPAKSDPLARFAILVSGRGKLWLDQVSLLPGDAVDGVRADVFEKVKALRPAFIRWPGGNVAQDYRWMWGIGPRDERTTWVNLSWKNEPEPSDFGTDEFIQFCRNVGAEPSITVNVEGRGATAEEAAAWVEYCNGPATSKYGAMRARNGHPQPYGVKFWEIGNEIWGNWVRGHSDAETYGRNYNRYYAAMRAVDPTIKFIAVGDNDMNWNRTVLRLAGERMDYLAIHHYYSARDMAGDPLNLMARPLYYERFYKQVEQLIREVVPGRPIKLNINEWGLDLPERRQHSIESALYGARLMNVFERSGDLVTMSAVSDLVNGWPGGIIQASRHGVFVTPTYLVNQLYNTRLGAERLAAKVESPTFDSSKEGKGVPYLDAVVSRSSDGGQIYIKAVNTDQKKSLQVSISITGVRLAPGARVEAVTANSLTSANSFSTPDAVSIKASEISAGNNFTIELPMHSVSVITLNVIR